MYSLPIKSGDRDMTEIYIARVAHKNGAYFPETDANATDRKSLLRDILTEQFTDIEAVFAFDPEEGWARDVTEDIAHELLQLADTELDMDGYPTFGNLEEFLIAQLGRGVVERALGEAVS
jgi:hypothetical protein